MIGAIPETPAERRAAGLFLVRAKNYKCGICFVAGKEIGECRIEPGSWARGKMPKAWEPTCRHRSAHVECVQRLLMNIYIDTGQVVTLQSPSKPVDAQRAE